MKEPLRYIANAKETLKKSAIEGSRYTDEKYIKSACGIAYLGVLKAIDEKLIVMGVHQKDVPRKVEEYRKALQKYVSLHNGKLLNEFNDIYRELHIAGYYHGDLRRVNVVKESIKGAEEFIKKLN